MKEKKIWDISMEKYDKYGFLSPLLIVLVGWLCGSGNTKPINPV